MLTIFEIACILKNIFEMMKQIWKDVGVHVFITHLSVLTLAVK